MVSLLMFCIVGPIPACPQPSAAQFIGSRGEVLAYAAQYQARDAWAYAVYAVPLQTQPAVFVVRR